MERLVKVDVAAVPRDDQPVLRALMELYKHDFSGFSGEDVSEHGTYGYTYLDHYWTEDGRFPFFVRVDGRLAGFALIRSRVGGSGTALSQITEFFIMRKYRRQGIGEDVATQLFSRFPGEWRVAQEASNEAAMQFWRRVISRYTNGRYREHPAEDGRLEQRFHTRDSVGAGKESQKGI